MKFRKLAALAMTAVLSVTALAGCGSNDDEKSDGKAASSISEAYEKAAAMEKYTLSGSFSMSMSGDDIESAGGEQFLEILGGNNGIAFSGTWEGKVDTKNNASDLNIGISLGGKTATDILDYVAVDGDIYIGLRTMADGIEKIISEVTDLDSDSAINLGAELPEGNYLKVSEETLKELLEMVEETYGDELEDAGISFNADSFQDMFSELNDNDEYKKLEETVSYFADLIVKGMKNSDSCFSNEGDTYKMTISKKNINEIISGVLKEVESNSEAIAEKINAITGEETVSGSDLKQMTSLFGAYDIASLMEDFDFSITLTASYVDDTFKTGIAVGVSDSSNRMAFSFENTAKEDDSIKISAPSDVISDEDAKPIIEEFKKGFQEGLDSTYGEISDEYEYFEDDFDLGTDDYGFGDYDFGDYDYDDYDDYDYDDYDFDDYDFDEDETETTTED